MSNCSAWNVVVQRASIFIPDFIHTNTELCMLYTIALGALRRHPIPTHSAAQAALNNSSLRHDARPRDPPFATSISAHNPATALLLTYSHTNSPTYSLPQCSIQPLQHG